MYLSDRLSSSIDLSLKLSALLAAQLLCWMVCFELKYAAFIQNTLRIKRASVCRLEKFFFWLGEEYKIILFGAMVVGKDAEEMSGRKDVNNSRIEWKYYVFCNISFYWNGMESVSTLWWRVVENVFCGLDIGSNWMAWWGDKWHYNNVMCADFVKLLQDCWH